MQKRSDAALGGSGHLVDRARREYISTGGSSSRAHLDEIIGLRKHTRVVIDNHHRVAVCNQIAHDAHQAVDIGRVQANRRLVQHIEHTRGAIAHHAGKLYALSLTRGKRGAGTVEREVVQAQIDQATRRR